MFSYKRVMLAISLVLAFSMGFGVDQYASAWPGVADRSAYRGYFKNKADYYGDQVIANGVPDYVFDSTYRTGSTFRSAEGFIRFIKGCLAANNNCGSNNVNSAYKRRQARVGAAFIIQTMIGTSRRLPPSSAQVAEWESRVRYAASLGRMKYLKLSFSVNSYFQDDVSGGDDAFYYHNGTNYMIVFNTASGTAGYKIRIACANPVGNLTPLPDVPPPPPPPVNYNIVPSASVNATSASEGDSVVFTFRVRNSGTTTSPNINCAVVGNERDPGWTPLPAQNANRTSDPGYVPPSDSCPRTFTAGSNIQVATQTVTIPGISAGSKICRSLVVSPRDKNGGPRVSAEACVLIAKTPWVHFQGNDVWAGGGFSDIDVDCNTQAKIQTASKAIGGGNDAGSLGEYAAFALDSITNFGSASRALVSSGSILPKQLTFANSEAGYLGHFGADAHCINDYLDQFSAPVTSMPASINVGSQSSGVKRITGNHTFSGTMPAGSHQVYIVQNGNATISSDLKYPNSYGSASQVPSLVIIVTGTGSNGNITVSNAVGQMDGLFIAKNRFITCPLPATVTVSTCNNQLVVNGAVIASRLDLNRTSGADGNDVNSKRAPAEIFNFAPEMYIRSALNDSSRTTIETIESRELPPRF